MLCFLILAIILIIYVAYLFGPCLKRLDELHDKYLEPFTGINVESLRLRNFYKSKGGGGAKTIIGLHYTNWCPHCKEMKPEWQKMKLMLEADPTYKIIEVDEEETPTPGINSFPTVIKCKNGLLTQYSGPKDSIQLLEFAQSS